MEIMPNVLKPRKPFMGKPTCAGDRYKFNTKLSIDKETGIKLAEPGDKFDLDADIQSYAASTDIVSIIARLQAGDEGVINVHTGGVSGDLTELPRDINDMVAFGGLNEQARAGFDKLPNDIKALFDNSPAVFFDAVLTNKVDEILKSYKPIEEAAEQHKEEGGQQ